MVIDLYKKLVRLAYQSYLNMLDNNLILGCPITTFKIKWVLKIYGKDAALIKGKIKRSSPSHIANPPLVKLSNFIQKWHINVKLCIDILYVHQMAFFHTIS